jgi:SNF2 family DNA or RNA helicase
MSMSAISDEILDEIKSVMGWLETVNPIVDVQEVLKNRDTKLWAIQGFGIYIPGTKYKNFKQIENEYCYRMLKGTSDAIYGDEHLRLIRLAEKYAKEYNKYIVSNYKKIIAITSHLCGTV